VIFIWYDFCIFIPSQNTCEMKNILLVTFCLLFSFTAYSQYSGQEKLSRKEKKVLKEEKEKERIGSVEDASGYIIYS